LAITASVGNASSTRHARTNVMLLDWQRIYEMDI